jgi:hypothetical protein
VPNVTQALKSEVSAALGVSAGVLVATGYLITWARLENEHLPTEAVLAALPKTFYLGVAVQSLVLPLFVLLTLGVAFVIGAWRQHVHDRVPTRVEWTVFGVALALYGSFFANVLNPFATASNDASYIVPALIGGVVVIAITYGIGRLAQARLEWVKARKARENERLETGDRLRVVIAAVVVACVVAVSLVRIVDARYAPRALPEAAAFTSRDDCPKPTTETERSAPGCLVTGFYIGESDQWLYLVAPNEQLVPGEARRKLPGRVYFLPRGSVRQLRLAKDLSRGIPPTAAPIPTTR